MRKTFLAYLFVMLISSQQIFSKNLFIGGNGAMQIGLDGGSNNSVLSFSPIVDFNLIPILLFGPMITYTSSWDNDYSSSLLYSGGKVGCIFINQSIIAPLFDFGLGLYTLSWSYDYGPSDTNSESDLGFFLRIEGGIKIKVRENAYIDIVPYYQYRKVDGSRINYLVFPVGVTINVL